MLFSGERCCRAEVLRKYSADLHLLLQKPLARVVREVGGERKKYNGVSDIATCLLLNCCFY